MPCAHAPAHGSTDPSAVERDCDLLRQECEALRRDLAAANERSQRLSAIVSQVEGRIDGAIERVDELAGSGTAR